MTHKIKVPEEMREAADKAIGEMRAGQASRLVSRNGELWPNDLKLVVLEVALQWLDEELEKLDRYPNDLPWQAGYNTCLRDMRHRFTVPEPEVPEGWVLLDIASTSGKLLWACIRCGHTSPCPSKNHEHVKG
jgi:hypothetical protein